MKNKFNIMLELSFCSYVHFAVSFSSFFFNIANQEAPKWLYSLPQEEQYNFSASDKHSKPVHSNTFIHTILWQFNYVYYWIFVCCWMLMLRIYEILDDDYLSNYMNHKKKKVV